MATREPINVTLLDPKQELELYGWYPVTSHQIYEASTTMFNPDGLFSEAIFGQIGSKERMEHFGYIQLNTIVFQPKIYKTLLTLKGIYENILSGKAYAKFDDTIDDFVLCSDDDPESGTGFSFFIKHFPNIVFTQTSSLGRKDKIALIEKYRSITLIDKYLVEPAGLRDIRTDPNGRQKSEEVNKLYLGLLALSQGIPKGMGENPIFDALRYNIQLKVMQIYSYIEDIVDGKRGFMLGKFAARSVALATRNVITAAPISAVTSPKDPKYLRTDEVLTPLFQAAKGLTPHVVHTIRSTFMDAVFTMETSGTSLIDMNTLELQYTEVADREKVRFTTDPGITQLINLFRNNFIRHRPVTVVDTQGKSFYVYLVYDRGDTIYLLRNKNDFKVSLEGNNLWSTKNVRHLELLDKYNIRKQDCIIYGSAAMIAHGYPGVNQDLDLVVSEECLTRLIKDHGFVEVESPKGMVYEDPTQTLEVVRHSVTLHRDFAQATPLCDIIDGYMFDTLRVCLAAYQALPRTKDRYKVEWLDKQLYDEKYIRPMTYAEMMYIAVYQAVALGPVHLHATVTRYPILNMYGILPSRINLQSTEPNRQVKLVHPSNPDLNVTLPRYPIYDAVFQDSMSVHSGALAGYDGDHDGDALTWNGLLTMQSNNEIKEFYQKPMSMINTKGQLISGLSSCKLGKYTLYMATRDPE